MNQFLNKNKFSIILFTILILHSVISISYFSGIYGSDDWLYARTAISVSQGNFSALDTFGGNRIGLIFPTAFFIKFIGVNEIAITLYPFLLSLLTIILVFKIGKTLFDEKIGILSAFIIATIPLQITQTTQLMPNLPLTFWLTFAIYIYIHPFEKLKRYKSFFIGLLIGIGYLHHITAGYLLIFIVIYSLFVNKSFKSTIFIILGFVLIFFLESILFRYIGISNKLIKLTTTYTTVAIQPTKTTFLKNTIDIFKHFFHPFWMTSFSIVPLITFIIYGFFFKKGKNIIFSQNFIFLVSWLIGILLLYLYFPKGLHFKPMIRVLTRYFIPILPPLSILLAVGLLQISLDSKKFLYVLLPVILLINLFFIQVDENNCISGKIRKQIVYKGIDLINKYRPHTVYADRKNCAQLDFFLFNKEYNTKRISDSYPNFENNSIIVYDKHRISSWHKNIEKDFPNFLKSNTNYELLETVRIKKNIIWKIMDKINPDGSDPDYYIGGYILYIK